MICPKCRSGLVRRSQRRGSRDFFHSLVGERPWRCRTCGERFYGWLLPLKFTFYVHCPRCGKMDVQRLPRDRVVDGWHLALATVLRFSAYRCDPCRIRFLSVRPYNPIVPTRTTPVPEPPPAAADSQENAILDGDAEEHPASKAE